MRSKELGGRDFLVRDSRAIVAWLCTIVSLPAALLYSMGAIGHALDDCRFGECHAHKLAYALTVPLYAFTWFVYGLMVIRWVSNKMPVKAWVAIAWALAVFAYPAIESRVDPSGLPFFLAVDLLPVAPALILGIGLAFRSFSPEATLDIDSQADWR
jgi:hypothetical protein